MKTPLLLASLLVVAVALRAAEPTSGYRSESKSVSELFSSPILKIYAASEGEHRYVAYVVRWKENEIVVVPSSYMRGLEDLKVGDTVRCQMTQEHHLAGDDSAPKMRFILMSGPGGPLSSVRGVSTSTAEEAARLEQVAQEVTRRRAQREAATQPIAPR